MGQVNSNLMGPPGLGLTANQGITAKPLFDLVKRHGRFAAVGGRPDRHLFTRDGVKADRLLDVVTVALGHAVDQCQVFFLHAAVLELKSELVVNALVLGDDQEARRVAVEAVDDAGPVFAGQRGKPIEMKLEGVDQGAAPVSSGRMGDHSGRLVDDGQILVFVDDLDG